jgi:rhodanese-related sulfurtransferase
MLKYCLLLSLAALTFSAYSQSSDDLNFRYKEITLPELMKKKQKADNSFIILDVRSKGEFNDTLTNGKAFNIGHIKGAINIPIQDLMQKPEVIQQLEPYKDKDIYVICSHSYRSRAISKLLLEKNFANIINVQGGMSEWYRNYDELKPFRSNYENTIRYKNISPSEVFTKMKSNAPIVFIGFKNAPRFFFDSMTVDFYGHFIDLKNIEYFTAKDSAAALAKAKSAGGKTIITFNTIGSGAGEIAEWLTASGVPDVNYLVGGLTGLYDYVINFQPDEAEGKYFTEHSFIHFLSPLSLCRALEKPNKIQLVDIRHDTLFAKPTVGTKLTYNHLKGAINFPYYRSANDFEKQFPDKSKKYVLLPHNGYIGMALADALLAKGYKLGWLMGGNERWEWYTNNTVNFPCREYLIN